MRKTITIPEQWSEVKYKDYYRFIESIKDQEDNNQLVTEMALQYLCNLDVESYHKLGKKIFNQITSDINQLLMSQDKGKLVTMFTVGDTEYRINPNIENMTYGEYLDLTNYSKDIWKNMPIVASILYRPTKYKLGDSYTLEPYNGTNDDTIYMFRELLTMDIVNGLLSFFLQLQSELLNLSLLSSTKTVIQEMTTQQLEDLQANGVDIKQLLHSVKEIYSSSIK